MTNRIAINGFGRIGRMLLRAIFEKKSSLKVIAINDLAPVETLAHLFKYDSVHGIFQGDVKTENGNLVINGETIKIYSKRNPAELSWAKDKIDLALECTGFFTKYDDAMLHIKAGAKKVLVSAPAAGADAVVVYGVNHDILKDDDIIISNASCTTNCLAPVVKVLNDNFAIKNGFMTTVHSYTGDQRLLDAPHGDLQRARSAALSMIPASTGAAKAIGLVLPELAGKIDGTSIRVPTPNVSLVNLVVNVDKNVTKEEVNNAFSDASNGYLKGILEVTDLPLVSIDFNHNPHSSIIDLNETYITTDNMIRVLSWYDNEWGFANRMIDFATYITTYNNGKLND